MFKHLFAAALIAACIPSTAATSQKSSALIGESEAILPLAVGSGTWSYVAAVSSFIAKVREFHDMGQAGVQQLDYVVDCTDGKLALAAFKVLTQANFSAERIADTSIDKVSFYAPVIQHDLSIVQNVCSRKLALNKSTVTN